MKKYLLPQSGTFYKANLHCHSNVSDGVFSPQEIKEKYKANGYSIVAYTDHDVYIPHPELKDDDFLPLNGFEVQINEDKGNDFCMKKTCHICFVALKPDNYIHPLWHRSEYVFHNAVNYRDQVKFDETKPDYIRRYNHECINEMMQIGKDAGFFVTYNHPSWSMENYNDYMGYNNMHAMEIANGGSIGLGYMDYSAKEYQDMLRGGKKIYCIAADDTHGERDMFRGFTMIKAEKLEYEAITDALLKGNFYSSEGPLINELWYEDGLLGIECSDAKSITVYTDNRRIYHKAAQDGETLTSACFGIDAVNTYIRVTITDEKGLHADTNAYYLAELNK